MAIDWGERAPVSLISDLEGFAKDSFMEVLEIVAIEGERYAQSSHRWRNITGIAEKGLKGSWAEIDESTFEIRIEYDNTVQANRPSGVYYYGLSLEYKHDERFAILPETVEFMFDLALKELEKRWQG